MDLLIPKLALSQVVLGVAPHERALLDAPVGLERQRPFEGLHSEPVVVAALAVALLAAAVGVPLARAVEVRLLAPSRLDLAKVTEEVAAARAAARIGL